MKRLNVVVVAGAQEQIRDQVLYISRDSVDHAFRWQLRLDAALLGLGDAPGHAIDVEASRRAGQAVHKLVFERTYLIFYRVNATAGVVQVVSFRHGARLPRPDEP